MVRHRRRKAFEESAFCCSPRYSTDSQMPGSQTLCRGSDDVFVSCLLLVHRTLARILNGERDVIIIASRTQPCFCASSTIPPDVGRQATARADDRAASVYSTLLFISGDRAQFFEQTHAIWILRLSGASTNGNAAISPKPVRSSAK